jgi:hypothetical protein
MGVLFIWFGDMEGKVGAGGSPGLGECDQLGLRVVAQLGLVGGGVAETLDAHEGDVGDADETQDAAQVGFLEIVGGAGERAAGGDDDERS